MTNIFRKPSSVKMPARDREPEHDEYGHEHKGIVECSVCKNAHFKKRWYASLEEIQEHTKGKMPSVTKTELCPACRMTKEHLYEGEVFAEGFPEEHQGELSRLIHNFGERATADDPQHRIIAVETVPTGLRITTTENKLADRLGKKIHETFASSKVKYAHSKEPFEVNRVHVTFHKE